MSTELEFTKESKKRSTKLPDLGDFQVQKASGDATAEPDKKYSFFDLVSVE